MSAYGHQAGEAIECLSLSMELHKQRVVNEHGHVVMRVGFRIGGGIDQDPSMAPDRYPDTGIYITYVDPGSPADEAGLRKHDKILQVNGIDFTMLTHEKAVKFIEKSSVLQMLVARFDLPQINFR